MTAVSSVKAHQKPPGHTLVSTMQTNKHTHTFTHTHSHWVIGHTLLHPPVPWLVINHLRFIRFTTNHNGNIKPNPDHWKQFSVTYTHISSTPCKQKSLHTDKIKCLIHTWRPWPYPPSSTGVQGQTHRRRATSINIWAGISLTNWCNIFAY